MSIAQKVFLGVAVVMVAGIVFLFIKHPGLMTFLGIVLY